MRYEVYCALGILILVIILSCCVSSVVYGNNQNESSSSSFNQLFENMENNTTDNSNDSSSPTNSTSVPQPSPSSQDTESKCEFIANTIAKNVMGNIWRDEKLKAGCNKNIVDYLDEEAKAKLCNSKSCTCPACQNTASSGQSPGETNTKCLLPGGISDGDVVQAQGQDVVYRVNNCQKQLYPNETIYKSYGSPTPIEITTSDLNQIANGPDVEMCNMPGKATNGNTVQCSGNASIYYLDGCKKRLYPSTQIYNSYGSPAPKIISCSDLNNISTGVPMPLKPSPAQIYNGKYIQAQSQAPNGPIYKVYGGQRHWVSSPQWTAASNAGAKVIVLPNNTFGQIPQGSNNQ